MAGTSDAAVNTSAQSQTLAGVGNTEVSECWDDTKPKEMLTSPSGLVQALSLDADCRVHGWLLHDGSDQGLLCHLYVLICA